MHFDDYAKILGDTLFEAKVKAEKTYGKDNFKVITSKKVKHPIYFGLGYREMFEITVGIIRPIGNKNVVTEVPSRPSPSIEVKKTNPVFSSQSETNTASTNTSAQSEAYNFTPPPPTKIRPAQNTSQGIRAYKSTSRTKVRAVDGLRSNQEGNKEPRSQKILNDKEIASTQIDEILEELIAVRETRERQEKIANGNLKSQGTLQSNFETSRADSNKMDTYETRLDQMYAMLREINQRFDKTIEKEPPKLPEVLHQIKKNLLDIETPVEIADRVIYDLRERLPEHYLQKAESAMKYTSQWMENKLKFSPDPNFNNSNGPKIIALIGPTGVGKTTTIAKIAASYGLSAENRLSIALFTLDTFRIGAADQLQQYARIIDVDMEILYRPEEIDQAVNKHLDKDLIIVDTAGRCQKDSEELCELGNFLDRMPESDKYLVLSATAKYNDMLETVTCFDHIGFEHLIFTKIDETNTFGPLLALLIETGKSLAYITNGQKVPEDFCKANFNFFNTKLFSERAYKHY
ncbi:MAG: hypothetical protein ACQETH_04560 [Candidatus Rifleibacteriota bacterium]